MGPTRRLRSRLKVLLAAALVLLVGLAWALFYAVREGERKGCFNLPQDVIPITITPALPDVLRFAALGDVGTGDENQRQVAQGLARVCQAEGCDFVLLLGDNFYPHGVQTLDDPRFASEFEALYGVQQRPVLALLGNHDTKGTVAPQVRYSLRSATWRMPNYQYAFSAGPARFVALNTNCLFQDLPAVGAALEALPAAPWTIVAGHHTLYTSSYKGDADPTVRWYWRTFTGPGVDFYLSGHAHELEHLQDPDGPTQIVVTGAGGENNLTGTPRTASRAASRFLSRDNGFAWFELTPSQARWRFYDRGGKVLYESQRQRAAAAGAQGR